MVWFVDIYFYLIDKSPLKCHWIDEVVPECNKNVNIYSFICFSIVDSCSAWSYTLQNNNILCHLKWLTLWGNVQAKLDRHLTYLAYNVLVNWKIYSSHFRLLKQIKAIHNAKKCYTEQRFMEKYGTMSTMIATKGFYWSTLCLLLLTRQIQITLPLRLIWLPSKNKYLWNELADLVMHLVTLAVSCHLSRIFCLSDMRLWRSKANLIVLEVLCFNLFCEKLEYWKKYWT